MCVSVRERIFFLPLTHPSLSLFPSSPPLSPVKYDVLFSAEFILSASCAFVFALAYAMMLVFWGEFYWYEVCMCVCVSDFI